MTKKYIVRLEPQEREGLHMLVSRGKGAARKLAHARILLQADVSEGGPGWTDEWIAEALGVTRQTVEHARGEAKPRTRPPRHRVRPAAKKAVSRRHCRCLNVRSSPAISLTSIVGRSVRLPAKKRQTVVGAEAAGPRQLPLRYPAEQFHGKPKAVRGHARRGLANGCLRKRLRGSDGQAPSLSGRAVRRG